MRLILITLFLILSIPLFALDSISVISTKADGTLGSRSSGYFALKSGFSPLYPNEWKHHRWAFSPVDDFGRVDYVSAQWPQEQDGNYHTYSDSVGSHPKTVLGGTLIPVEHVRFEDLHCEVRVPSAGGNSVLWYSFANSGQRAIKLAGYTNPRYLTLLPTTDNKAAVLYCIARGVDGRYKLVKQVMARFAGWAVLSLPQVVVEDSTAHISAFRISADQSSIVYVKGDDLFLKKGTSTATNLTAQFSGQALLPAISADGSKVAWQIAGKLYVHHIASGVTYVLCEGEAPAFSADARYMTFLSGDSLVSGVSNSFNQIYRYDFTTKGIIPVSAASSDHCLEPAISPNGQFITFTTRVQNLTATGNSAYQVILADCGTSPNSAPQLTTDSFIYPSKNQLVKINVKASDADPRDSVSYTIVEGPQHGVVKNSASLTLTTGLWTSVNSAFPLFYMPNAGFRGLDSFKVQLKDDKGNYSFAKTIKVNVQDYSQGYTSLLTGGEDTPTPAFSAARFAVDSAGKYMVYTKTKMGTTLTGVFVKDLIHNFTRQLFIQQVAGDNSFYPTISASGNAVSFVAGSKIYWCPIGANGVEISNMKSQSLLSSASQVSLSSDGHTVVFQSATRVYTWMPLTGSMNLIATGHAPIISPSSHVIAYVSGTKDIVFMVSDNKGGYVVNSGLNYSEGVGNVSELSISYNGAFLAYKAGSGVKVLDVINHSEKFSIPKANYPSIATGGRYLYAFEGGDVQRAYIYDIFGSANDKRVVSKNNEQAAAAPNSIYRGRISHDGSVVYFVSSDELVNTDLDSTADIYQCRFGFEDNVAPTVNDYLIQITEDVDKAVQLTVVDGNPSDKDFAYVITTSPTKGTLVWKNFKSESHVVYKPQLNYNSTIGGNDRFAYKVFDGHMFSREIVVTVNIAAVNDKPVWVKNGTKLYNGMRYDLYNLVNDVDSSTLTFVVNGVTLTEQQARAYDPSGYQGGSVLVRDGVGDSVLTGGFKFELTNATFNLAPGWNLVSLPYAPANKQEFIDAGEGNSLWYWADGKYTPVITDPKQAGFTNLSEIKAGRGFWLFRNTTTSAIINYRSVVHTTSSIEITPGWNLVGPIGAGDPLLIPSSLEGQSVWRWKSLDGYYVDVRTEENPSFNGLMGYWIYGTESETIELNLQ